MTPTGTGNVHKLPVTNALQAVKPVTNALKAAKPVTNALQAANPVLNNIPVKSTPVKSNPLLNAYYDVREGIHTTSDMVQKVNPATYLKEASRYMEKQTYNEDVKYINIIYTTFYLLSCVFSVVSFVISGFIWTMITVMTSLIKFSIFIAPFLPLLLFIGLFAYVTAALWEDLTEYVFKPIIQAYNGVIRQWNKITDAVRSIGFDVPLKILGKNVGFRVNLGGINLPHGTEANPTIESFWSYVGKILWIAILDPLMESTKGTIIRE